MDSSLSRAIVSSLADSYEFAEPIELEFLARGANDNYLMRQRDSQCVLRLYRENEYYPRTADTYRFELDLLRFLERRGVPVVSPVQRNDGDLLGTIRTSERPRYAALFHFVTGEPHAAWHPVFNRNEVRRLGAFVAALHDQADDFRSSYHRYDFDLFYLVDEPLRLFEERLKAEGQPDLAFFG